MKVTPDRIKARAEQLRTTGFRLRADMVRATLELNSGARVLTHARIETEKETAGPRDQKASQNKAA